MVLRHPVVKSHSGVGGGGGGEEVFFPFTTTTSTWKPTWDNVHQVW
jgi:hypothetical protein